jgi:hypothetical protein
MSKLNLFVVALVVSCQAVLSSQTVSAQYGAALGPSSSPSVNDLDPDKTITADSASHAQPYPSPAAQPTISRNRNVHLYISKEGLVIRRKTGGDETGIPAQGGDGWIKIECESVQLRAHGDGESTEVECTGAMMLTDLGLTCTAPQLRYRSQQNVLVLQGTENELVSVEFENGVTTTQKIQAKYLAFDLTKKQIMASEASIGFTLQKLPNNGTY